MSQRDVGTSYIVLIVTPVTIFEPKQDEIFRRKRLSTGENFVHVGQGILKFNKFSM